MKGQMIAFYMRNSKTLNEIFRKTDEPQVMFQARIVFKEIFNSIRESYLKGKQKIIAREEDRHGRKRDSLSRKNPREEFREEYRSQRREGKQNRQK